MSPSDINTENDGEIFGWALTNQWHHVGNMYYFLLSAFNIIETKQDESPIIDSKGYIQGHIDYSIFLSVVDSDLKGIDLTDYESLNDLIGKKLQMTVCLHRARNIPEKMSFATMLKYNWVDDAVFNSKEISESCNPEYNYSTVHTVPITEELISYLMYNTLTIGVFGKFKPIEKGADGTAKSAIKQKSEMPESTTNSNALHFNFNEGENDQLINSPTKNAYMSDAERIKILERKNAELEAKLVEANKKKKTCNIF